MSDLLTRLWLMGMIISSSITQPEKCSAVQSQIKVPAHSKNKQLQGSR